MGNEGSTSPDVRQLVSDLCLRSKKASRVLALASADVKNRALEAIATRVDAAVTEILRENDLDVQAAIKGGMSAPLLDRLKLTPPRVAAMSAGLRQLTALADPVGEVVGMTTQPSGLQIGQVRAPLGVIGIVYESRPNVTVDAAGLCLKAGNAVVLRGGSEATASNRLLGELVSLGLADAGLPSDSVCVIPTTSRDGVTALSQQRGVVDLLIARGSGAMIRALSEAATIPLVEHGGGVCHVYIHEDADIEKAIAIAVNAKVSRPGVCNSAETFLVDASIADQVLPPLSAELRRQGVAVRACGRCMPLMPGATPACEEDWRTEYLDLIVSIKVVEGLGDAIGHINEYSTHHSDAIVTQDYSAARAFLAAVDSAAVYVNASTRFTDGGQFGLGAEIGISTQKLHARGPMGVKDLTCLKYIIYGEGQIRV